MDLTDLIKRQDRIQRTDIKEFTLEVIKRTPERAWKAPSSRDHHSLEERGEWGNLIHSIRVVDTAWILADIFALGSLDRDVLHSAASLHDIGKRGVDGKGIRIVSNHPQLVRVMVENMDLTCEYKEQILFTIEKHMGRWGRQPTVFYGKVVDIAMLLHIADCIEARWTEVVPE